MATVDFDSIKGLDVIGQDACILGEIMDIRYEDLTWNIQGFKVKSEKSVSKKIAVGSGKSMLLLQPGKYVFGDVVLMPDSRSLFPLLQVQLRAPLILSLPSLWRY